MKQEREDDGYGPMERSFEGLNCRAFLEQSSSSDSEDAKPTITNNNDPKGWRGSLGFPRVRVGISFRGLRWGKALTLRGLVEVM